MQEAQKLTEFSEEDHCNLEVTFSITYLLCCFNSFILHPQYGKSFQEDILCGFWHCSRQRNS